MEKTIEIKAIDKEKALKRASNILGVELTDNETVDIVEKVAPRKKFFGLLGTEPGIYEVSIKTKQEEKKEIKEHKEHKPHVHKYEKEKTEKHVKNEKVEKPEKAEKVEKTEKVDHSEQEKEISEKVAKIINEAKAEGRRIISAGTTATRALESSVDENGKLIAQKKDTGIFIYPGYKFKIVDALITNFHLPKSTLLMLVSAFYDREKMLEIYNLAVKEKYHFFSFGDNMFIY